MASEYFIILVFCALLRVSEGYIRCGEWDCYGSGAYCCNGYPKSCCFYMWSFWWFWMFWVFLFCFLVSCGYWCRRRYRRPDYVLIQRPSPGATYGSTATPGDPTGALYGAPTGPAVPQKPPAYTDQDPPAYSA